MEKLTLQKVHLIWFTDFAIRISFYFEKIHGRKFKKYEMELKEWFDAVTRNHDIRTIMIVFRRVDYYEISFDFSFSLFRYHSYSEIEDLFLKLFSKIKSISEIEKPFEFIDAFVDNILLEESLFMECVDSESFIRKNEHGTTNIHEIGMMLYEMIKSTFHMLFDDNDIKLYVQGTLGL